MLRQTGTDSVRECLQLYGNVLEREGCTESVSFLFPAHHPNPTLQQCNTILHRRTLPRRTEKLSGLERNVLCEDRKHDRDPYGASPEKEIYDLKFSSWPPGNIRFSTAFKLRDRHLLKWLNGCTAVERILMIHTQNISIFG